MAWIQAWIQAWSRSAFWLAIDVAASPKKIYAVHVDHLNRPVMLTDAAKVNVWSASFEPFGKVRTVTGTVTQNLGLPGQRFQLEHGLAYNWHRHYDPTTGRYTTADPLGFVEGPSVFAYVGSAPHTKVDPTGQFLWAPALAVAAVAILTPSNTFSPGNDLEPYVNAAMVGGGFALQACVRGVYSAIGATSLWPAASGGRTVINGIEYTFHALERMQPVGTVFKNGAPFSRGVPPSAVANAVKHGTVAPGNSASEVVRTFENVRVITNPAGPRVISVIKTGD